jgi:hypothetical protein
MSVVLNQSNKSQNGCRNRSISKLDVTYFCACSTSPLCVFSADVTLLKSYLAKCQWPSATQSKTQIGYRNRPIPKLDATYSHGCSTSPLCVFSADVALLKSYLAKCQWRGAESG